MIDKEKMRSEGNEEMIKCSICSVPIKVWYDHNRRPISEQYKLLKKTVLKGWATFLDEVSKLPKHRQLFHISRTAKYSIIANELEKLFSEDELIQFTKFEKKMDIFKIGLEGLM